MHQSPDRSLRDKLSAAYLDESIDNAKAIELKKALAEEFRTQLSLGVPTNSDEAGLQRLARQIRAKKVVVKLFYGTHCTQNSTFFIDQIPLTQKLVL